MCYYIFVLEIYGLVFGGIVFQVILGFLFGGSTPGLWAGLLGVLGAAMSGPGLHPRPKGADALSAFASPKQRFTPSGINAHYPAILHERFARRSIGPDGRLMPKTPRRPPPSFSLMQY